MINSEFSYENLQTASFPIVKENAVALTFPESHFIGLFQKPSAESNVNLGNRVGWVTYISLKEEGGNMERAWNLLKDIFLEFHVTFVLLPKREYRLTKQEELGRQITIFQYLSRHVNLQMLIQKMATTLFSAGIEVGDEPVDLKKIPGGRYFSYHDNEREVISQRKALEEQNPELTKTENFMSEYFHSSTYDLPPSVDLPLALKLLECHQIFYEIDRRLPMKFSFAGFEDGGGRHIKFDGNVLLAMKITEHALKSIKTGGVEDAFVGESFLSVALTS